MLEGIVFVVIRI